MNIFYLDKDPKLCAQYHFDKHCIKMCTEYAQLLSMAMWVHDEHNALFMYDQGFIMNAPSHVTGKKRGQSHYVHPSALWVQRSRKNFDWLRKMAIELGNEYFYRYGYAFDVPRHHRSLVNCILHLHSTDKFPNKKFTQPPQAMPDEYRGPDSVEAYRRLYGFEKIRFGSYTRRPMPVWFVPYWRTQYLNRDAPSIQLIEPREFKPRSYSLMELK